MKKKRIVPAAADTAGGLVEVELGRDVGEVGQHAQAGDVHPFADHVDGDQPAVGALLECLDLVSDVLSSPTTTGGLRRNRRSMWSARALACRIRLPGLCPWR